MADSGLGGIGDWFGEAVGDVGGGIWDSTIGAFKLPDVITASMEKVGYFFDSVDILLLNLSVILTVILFFLIVVGLFWIPIKLYPMYLENKVLIDKVVKLGSVR